MPRLRQELSLHPADLFERPRSEADLAPLWWAMYTKPRAEKAFARQFLEMGGSFFVPQYPKRTLHRSRVSTSYLPLFPGYVFVFGQESDRIAALKTNLIVQTLKVHDQSQLHEDLASVNRLMQVGSGLAPEDRLEPGMNVEITQGALRGLVGRVIRRENHMKFLVEVRLLQRGVSVEIESWMIARSDSIPPAPRNEIRASRRKPS